MKDNIDQIKHCRAKSEESGFMYKVYEAKRKAAAGKEQVYCLLCQRWKWQDKLCDNALLRADKRDPIAREWDTPEEDEAWKDL